MVMGFLVAISNPAKNVCEMAMYNMGSIISIFITGMLEFHQSNTPIFQYSNNTTFPKILRSQYFYIIFDFCFH